MTTEALRLFTDEQKTRFYDMAEEYLAENDLECLKIDRDRFAYSGKEHIVKIFLLPFNKKTVSREQLARAKEMDNVVITNDRYSRHKPGTVIATRENGYVRFSVNEEDG